MTPEQKLYAALTVGSPTSEIEEIVGDRIYPVRVPAGQGIPALAYQKVSTEYDRTIHRQPAIMRLATFDVFCVAVDHTAAEALGDLVEALNVDGIRIINRSSTVGDEEDAPFAAIITIEVDVQE